MKIWLINPYGPIPGEGWRDYRFTLLGKTLASRGHDVVWWTANFSHHFKRHRSEGWRDVPVTQGFQIRLVPTTAYTKNIGWGRVRYEATFSARLYARGIREESPDCIIGIDPPQMVGLASVKLARRLRVPLILDVFDLWPELFELAFPRAVRPLAPAVLSPLYMLRRHNLRRADAVVSLCRTYLDAACEIVPRVRNGRSIVAFNGVDVSRFRASAAVPLDSASLRVDLEKRPGDVWAIFAGTLGNNYDVLTLLGAAELLQSRQPNIRFLIAGEGPLRPQVSELIRSRQLANTSYLGTVRHDDLARIYQSCDIGLSAYGPGSNVAMPDKAYDYMAAGLPIVNSLRGELETLVAERGFGIQYSAGDATSLAEALGRLAANEGLRKRMAANSSLAAMEFDTNVQYAKYAEFVERLRREWDVGGREAAA